MSQGMNRPDGEPPIEPTRPVTRRDAASMAGALPATGLAGINPANQEDNTQVLPPRLVPRPPRPRGRSPKWLVAGFILLAVLTIAVPTLYYAQFGGGGNGSTKETPGAPVTCTAQDSPCEIAKLYLAAYVASDYETMYQYVSDASKTTFADPAIRGTIYSSAHDYIVNRTKNLLNQAEVYAIAVTQGSVDAVSPTRALVPVHVVMHTIREGDITQDIRLPLVLEKTFWHVNWTPGLVFKALDDPADPQYQRLVRLTILDAPRGRILARDGTILAEDETVYSINLDPSKITAANASQVNQTLATDLDSTPNQIRAHYQGATQPVHLLTVTQQTYSNITADLAGLQSAGIVKVTPTTGRVYPLGADAAAVTGYVSAIQASDLLNDPAHYYETGDVKGRDGIEGWAEEQLRPTKGGELDIVDPASGQPEVSLARQSAEAGSDVHTTLNVKLEQAATSLMRSENHASGAAAIDPANGELLVLASNPIYNPNDFSLGFSDNESVRFNALLPQSPYLNRAVAGQYPIGSIMKVTTLAAGLENGIGANQPIDCTGSYQIPGQPQPSIDDKPSGHGLINPVIGLYESCDVVFWTIGVTLNSKDPNILPNMARSFGYGSLTKVVGLPDGEEQSGLVPDPTWLKQFNGGTWAPVDAANLAIGQGFFTATPLQIAVAAGAVANGGTRWQPRLVTSIVDHSGKTISSYAPAALGKLPVSSDHLAVIQTAMLDVTTLPGATSYGGWTKVPFLVAAKTGTAQTSTPNPDALFMCYAPASPLSGPAVQATIAASAVVEYSGFGDTFAAPITRAILVAYLSPS